MRFLGKNIKEIKDKEQPQKQSTVEQQRFLRVKYKPTLHLFPSDSSNVLINPLIEIKKRYHLPVSVL
jgi:hypothetical protein